MPRKLDVDYGAAKLLYLKGLSLTTISEKTKIPLLALRKHATRQKWAEQKTKTEQVMSSAVSTGLVNTAKEHVNTVLDVLTRHVNALRKRDPEELDLESLDLASKILDRLDQIGRRSHGLDADSASKSHSGLVQIVVNTTQLSPPQPVIDIIESTSSATHQVEADSVLTDNTKLSDSSVE